MQPCFILEGSASQIEIVIAFYVTPSICYRFVDNCRAAVILTSSHKIVHRSSSSCKQNCFNGNIYKIVYGAGQAAGRLSDPVRRIIEVSRISTSKRSVCEQHGGRKCCETEFPLISSVQSVRAGYQAID